jgi:hypothetical protein
LRYDFILFRWPVDKFGADAGMLSASAFGAVVRAMLMPRPTRWALLDAGVRAFPGLEFPDAYLSEVQCFTRCTELSKLLCKEAIVVIIQSEHR